MAKDTVIFISTHDIQFIQGSCDRRDMIRIDDFKSYPLEEGAMINGVITDDSAVKDQLSILKSNGISNARLIIDSGQIIIKNIVIPFLKKKEILKIVQDEVANVDQNYEDLIYDYTVMQKKLKDHSGGEILCCALEKKMLAGYIDLFQAAGIKLKSIDVSVNALLKLTRELPELEAKTYIISVIDGNNVSSYLFENNHYTFSNRTRLFSERGSESFAQELNSHISQLIQFNKSKQSPYTIEITYFCGLSHEEELLVYERIKDNLLIDSQPFPNSKAVYVTNMAKERDFNLHSYVYPVGCLIRK